MDRRGDIHPAPAPKSAEKPLAEEVTTLPDPLTQVQKIILETAQSPQEQASAKKINAKLEEYRKWWKNAPVIDASQKTTIGVSYEESGLQMWDFLHRLSLGYGQGGMAPTPLARIDGQQDFALFEIIEKDQWSPSRPSPNFLNSRLKNLGVLKEEDTMEDLKKLPAKAPDESPYYDPANKRAGRLPTKIKDVFAEVEFLWSNPKMYIALSPQARDQAIRANT